jgi:hypothetical protein
MIEIDAERKLAIINGFVEIPNGLERHKNKITEAEALNLISGSSVVIESYSDRRWFVLPEYEVKEGPTEDYFAILREAAEA